MNKIKKAGKVDLEQQKSKKSKITKAKKSTYKPKIKSGRIKGVKKTKIPKVSVKVKQEGKYSKFMPKKVLEQITNGTYTFTKAQARQYNQLNKRAGITKYEYLKMYYGVRKANAKARRLAKEGNALYSIKYSTKFKRIHTKYDYQVLMTSVSKVLSRDYKEKRNLEYIERFKNNVYAILSDAAAENIIKLVDKMSAAQLKDFIDENPDIEKIMYESDPEKFSSFDREATSLLENRLRNYLGLDTVDIQTKYDVQSESDLIR